MSGSKNRPTRKRRRFRPLRRALLLIVSALLVYGLLKTATWTYALVFGERVRVVRAAEIAVLPLYTGAGVLLRDEIIVIAPRSGTVNIIAPGATEITAGQEIVEIVDRDRLAELERLIAEEQAKRGSPGEDPAVTLANAESLLRQTTQTLRNLSQSYAESLRKGNSAEAAALFREIDRATEQLNKHSIAYTLAQSASEDRSTRYEELLQQRATAIHMIVAPVAGVISWVVDEMSGSAVPGLNPDQTAVLLGSLRPEQAPLASGAQVVAGGALCSIIDPASMILALRMSDEKWKADSPVDVRVNGKAVNANLWKTVPGEDALSLYYFRLISLPRELVDSRRVDVKILPVREASFSVPASSLTQKEGVTSVFAVSDSGTVIAVAVNVLEQKGKHAIVTGLGTSLWIVSNPAQVAVGDTLRKPKGG